MEDLSLWSHEELNRQSTCTRTAVNPARTLKQTVLIRQLVIVKNDGDVSVTDSGRHPKGMEKPLIALLLSHHHVDWLAGMPEDTRQPDIVTGRFIRTVMKTRRAPGYNRRRQGDTDEWLKDEQNKAAVEARYKPEICSYWTTQQLMYGNYDSMAANFIHDVFPHIISSPSVVLLKRPNV
ncbi:uncharacterized protein V6R79_016608 [Siganus canaliculatus]